MFTELFDRATACLEKGLPFTLYSKPNSGRLNAIFQKDDQIHYVEDYTEKGFVFAPFNVDSKAILLQCDTLLNATMELDTLIPVSNENDVLLSKMDQGPYLELIKKALGEIQKGKLDKVVLSRKIEVAIEEAATVLFQRVLKTYPTAFCYLWHHPKVGTWMGATPEILLKSKGLEFTTMSLAGTQSVFEFAKPQWTKKEINEQHLVTQYILKALKEVALSVKSAAVESIQAGNLWHLRTKLKGRFAPNTFGELVKAIHPTPAVCGIPMGAAKTFIEENEFYDRRFYTGFLGELNFKSELNRNRNRRNQENSAYRSVVNTSELFVNLRCMQLYGDNVDIYVGGGITADSNPLKEWDETVSKSGTMLGVLNHK